MQPIGADTRSKSRGAPCSKETSTPVSCSSMAEMLLSKSVSITVFDGPVNRCSKIAARHAREAVAS